MLEQVYDMFKRPIEFADLVVYPDRHGSSMWMNAGWVQDWNAAERTLQVRQRNADGSAGRLSTIRRLDRVVRVEL